MQHSAYTVGDVVNLALGARAGGIDNFVRIPSLDPPLITCLLDSGVQGVMIPDVKTPDEVVHVVRGVKYPPTGERSIVLRYMHTDLQKLDAVEMTRRSNEQTLKNEGHLQESWLCQDRNILLGLK